MKTLTIIFTIAVCTSCLLIGISSAQMGSGIQLGNGFSANTSPSTTPTNKPTNTPNPSTTISPTNTPQNTDSPAPSPFSSTSPTPYIISEFPIYYLIAILCVSGVVVLIYYSYKKSDKNE